MAITSGHQDNRFYPIDKKHGDFLLEMVWALESTHIITTWVQDSLAFPVFVTFVVIFLLRCWGIWSLSIFSVLVFLPLLCRIYLS